LFEHSTLVREANSSSTCGTGSSSAAALIYSKQLSSTVNQDFIAFYAAEIKEIFSTHVQILNYTTFRSSEVKRTSKFYLFISSQMFSKLLWIQTS
jgi:hypothetical protein